MERPMWLSPRIVLRRGALPAGDLISLPFGPSCLKVEDWCHLGHTAVALISPQTLGSLSGEPAVPGGRLP